MVQIVAQLTTEVKHLVAQRANDLVATGKYPDLMDGRRKTQTRNPTPQDSIYRGRQPRRPHFIREWADKSGYHTQAELVEALGADKSLVSRWYDGSSPGVDWQEKLAALFGHPGDRELVFRHPDDDWLARFFRGRSDEEVQRMKHMLEAAFPEKHNNKQ